MKPYLVLDVSCYANFNVHECYCRLLDLVFNYLELRDQESFHAITRPRTYCIEESHLKLKRKSLNRQIAELTSSSIQ